MVDAEHDRRPGRYRKDTLEFERLAFFSDAIFAIALTLLVVGLEVPRVPDSERDLWNALRDLQGQVLMFFISFAVLGSFWLRHHRFFSRLGSIDRALAAANLAYLGFIAFLPFPSAVLGQYGENSVAVATYALCIAVVAAAQVMLQLVAERHDLLARKPPLSAVPWGVLGGMISRLPSSCSRSRSRSSSPCWPR